MLIHLNLDDKCPEKGSNSDKFGCRKPDVAVAAVADVQSIGGVLFRTARDYIQKQYLDNI